MQIMELLCSKMGVTQKADHGATLPLLPKLQWV